MLRRILFFRSNTFTSNEWIGYRFFEQTAKERKKETGDGNSQNVSFPENRK